MRIANASQSIFNWMFYTIQNNNKQKIEFSDKWTTIITFFVFMAFKWFIHAEVFFSNQQSMCTIKECLKHKRISNGWYQDTQLCHVVLHWLLGQWYLWGGHWNLDIDGHSLPGLTSKHSYDCSSEPKGRIQEYISTQMNHVYTRVSIVIFSLAKDKARTKIRISRV